MSRVIFGASEHENGGCIFGSPTDIDWIVPSDVCIFDTPHLGNGCIFDNNLLIQGTRPYRKGWRMNLERLRQDDEDILTILVCATGVIH